MVRNRLAGHDQNLGQGDGNNIRSSLYVTWVAPLNSTQPHSILFKLTYLIYSILCVADHKGFYHQKLTTTQFQTTLKFKKKIIINSNIRLSLLPTTRQNFLVNAPLARYSLIKHIIRKAEQFWIIIPYIP